MVIATTAAANATSTVASNPGASILKTLNAGSGIDTATLVAQLTSAERASADASLGTRTTQNNAQVSALAQVRSGLDAFVSALGGLSAAATLGPQPLSSDTLIVGVALDPSVAGSVPINVSLTVAHLAAAQTIVSPRYASATAPVGQGTLTLTLGTLAVASGAPTGFTPGGAAPITITINAGNDSLNGVRDAINAANSGVTASILNDGPGAHLVLKGASGAANGFTLTSADAAANPDSASLSALAFGSANASSTLSSQAADAQFAIDGVAITRATNTVSDALAGYTLTLNALDPNTPITVSAARDTGLTKAAVKDYVAAYNTLIGLLDTDAAPGVASATGGSTSAGPLYGQSTIQILRSQLARLSSEVGGGTSLAALGVKTAQNGTLSIDSTMLDAATASDTGQIQRLFAGTPKTDGSPPTGTGIDGAVKAMRDGLAGLNGGFATYLARLTTDQTAIASDATALDARIAGYTATLDTQFAAMNAAVAQYKSISSFLTQQIDAWNHTSSNGNAVTA